MYGLLEPQNLDKRFARLHGHVWLTGSEDTSVTAFRRGFLALVGETALPPLICLVLSQRTLL